MQIGSETREAEPVRLDWGLQTTVLRRLCASRPKSLELMTLVALGFDDDELRSALGLGASQFDAEVDSIQADFERLSRAFFAHDALRRRADFAALALSPAAEAALEIIGEQLLAGRSLSPAHLLDELRTASFGELIEKIAGDLNPFLGALGKLPKLLPKPAASQAAPLAPDSERGLVP